MPNFIPRRDDAEMRIESPLPVSAAFVTAALLVIFVGIATVANWSAVAVVGVVALIVARVVALTLGWPPRAMSRAKGHIRPESRMPGRR